MGEYYSMTLVWMINCRFVFREYPSSHAAGSPLPKSPSSSAASSPWFSPSSPWPCPQSSANSSRSSSRKTRTPPSTSSTNRPAICRRFRESPLGSLPRNSSLKKLSYLSSTPSSTVFCTWWWCFAWCPWTATWFWPSLQATLRAFWSFMSLAPRRRRASAPKDVSWSDSPCTYSLFWISRYSLFMK